MGCFHEIAGVIFAIFQYFAKKIEKKSEKKFSEKIFFCILVRRSVLSIKTFLQLQNSTSKSKILFFLVFSYPVGVGPKNRSLRGSKFQIGPDIFLAKFFQKSKKSQKWSPDLGVSIGPRIGVIGGHSGELEHPTFFFSLVKPGFSECRGLYLAKYAFQNLGFCSVREIHLQKNPIFDFFARSDSQKKILSILDC